MKKVALLTYLSLSFIACNSNSSTDASHKDSTTTQATPATTATSHNATNTNDAGQPLNSFVPDGYEILQQAKGNLNRDNFDDAILVLKKSNEESEYQNNNTTSERPVLILISTNGNGYKKVAENDNAVLEIGEGGAMGDAFSGITIKNGYFTLEHMGGANDKWTRFITFKYDNADQQFYLHKDISEGFNSSDPNTVTYHHEKTTKDFGKVLFKNFNVNNE